MAGCEGSVNRCREDGRGVEQRRRERGFARFGGNLDAEGHDAGEKAINHL